MIRFWTCGRRLEDLLGDLPENVDRIVLCSPFPETAAQYRAYLRDGAMLSGWGFVIRHAKATGVCEAALLWPGGRRVRVTSAASWFGRRERSEDQVRSDLLRLAARLKRLFPAVDRIPLVSPATCGGALWRSEAGERYPPLDEETQTLIRSTSGQGREQFLIPRSAATIPHFEYWDMRLAYPAFMEHLPVGPVIRDEGSEVPLVGRVRVEFRAPRGWQHVGIMPAKGAFSGLTWPLAGEGWCDSREARYAISQGWKCVVRERLVMREGDPLDSWARRLRGLYARCEAAGEDTLARAARSILLNTVADFYGRGRAAPVGTGKVAISQARRAERVSHPEWTAAVWARCRHRLTKYLLSVPREILLGCWIDCAYLSADPGWEAGERAGHMRRKGLLWGERPAPKNNRGLSDLGKLASGSPDDDGWGEGDSDE